MPAQLVALSEGPNILLDKPILLFGRNPECDIQIDSRKVSRRHCCIAQVNDYLVVRDLGSTNGIRVNGVRVNEGRLKGGDELTIGSHRYQIRWDPLEARGHRAAPLVEPDVPRAGADPEDDDELLESCDDPVALNEADGTPRAVMHAPALSLGNTAMAGDKNTLLPGGVDKTNGLVIPDDLNLAPASDAKPRKNVKPSPPG